jgi:D-beta-D-heptose 7-phosphate kinase/D-beta-D-heptose 1-phosphate adenosyltransferase
MAGLLESKKKIIIDPKPQNVHLYRGAFLVKPNASEACQMTGKDCVTEEGVTAAGKGLVLQFGSHVILTRGRQGVSLFERAGDVTHIPTAATEVFDVTGAGDTVTAALALSIAAGATLKEACIIANTAAGIKVGKTGTATVSQHELVSAFEKRGTKVRNLGELAMIVEDLKRKGKKVVFTNGCYDILHVGHTRLLQQARALGDVLVLGLNSDASVRRLKGPTRPVIPQEERAEILSSLSFVDHILFFDEDTPVNVIGALRPDIHVKGGDWRIEDLPERSVIEGYGGKIVIIPHVEGKSTTNIVNKIKAQGAESARKNPAA